MIRSMVAEAEMLVLDDLKEPPYRATVEFDRVPLRHRRPA